jgi:hypothetical protein
MKSDDQSIADEAVVFAKANRKKIARRLRGEIFQLTALCINILLQGRSLTS